MTKEQKELLEGWRAELLRLQSIWYSARQSGNEFDIYEAQSGLYDFIESLLEVKDAECGEKMRKNCNHIFERRITGAGIFMHCKLCPEKMFVGKFD